MQSCTIITEVPCRSAVNKLHANYMLALSSMCVSLNSIVNHIRRIDDEMIRQLAHRVRRASSTMLLLMFFDCFSCCHIAQ